jgi:hypothetical protein
MGEVDEGAKMAGFGSEELLVKRVKLGRTMKGERFGQKTKAFTGASLDESGDEEPVDQSGKLVFAGVASPGRRARMGLKPR